MTNVLHDTILAVQYNVGCAVMTMDLVDDGNGVEFWPYIIQQTFSEHSFI